MPHTVRRILPAAALLTLAVAALALQAQQAQDPATSRFRSGVDVVQLDVAVLDRDRLPVRGLTAADFTVMEDGQPRPIVSFLPVDVAAPVTTAGWMRDVAPDVVVNNLDARRIIVILMDDANTSFDPSVAKTGKLIATRIVEQMGPDDLAAVVFTFMGRSQNLTNDRRRLLAAIESYTPRNARVPPSGSERRPGVFSGISAGAPSGCTFRGTTGCVLDTLRRIADALPTLPPRRKIVAFITRTSGFLTSTSTGSHRQMRHRFRR